jgi:hypothetical protein
VLAFDTKSSFDGLLESGLRSASSPAMTSSQQRFPRPVRDAMRTAGAMATCVPVQLGGSDWEAAFFFQVAGPESKDDRRAMRRATGPFAVGLETDLVETDHGAVVIMRPELHTRESDPLALEILLTPGDGGAHHEALRLLATQPALTWLFADRAWWVIHAQSHPLGPHEHAGFRELAADSLRHDTMVRMTSSYDAAAALGEVVRHYELRAAAPGPAAAT